MIRRHAFGGTSGLWEIARMPALVVTVLMLAIRPILARYVTR